MRFKLLLVFLVSTGALYAQQQPFSAAQLFKNEKTNVWHTLPTVSGWADDSHYLLLKDKKTYSIDAKTGQEGEDTRKSDWKVSPPLSALAGANSQNPTVSPDGKWLAFTRDSKDLYLKNLGNNEEKRLTSDGSETVYNGYAAWVYWEEVLGRNTQHKAFWWSPDSKYLAFMRFDEAKVPVFAIAGATGQHGYLERQRYPKPGDPNPLVQMGLVEVASGKIVWADFDANADHYFGTPFWTPDSKALWMQLKNRAQDNLKLLAVDPATGRKTELVSESQKTWVDWLTTVHFLPDGKHFIRQSDESGWMHLYLHTMDGRLKNPITSGNYTVTGLSLIDAKNGWVYFTARKENSARIDLYKVKLDGKGLQRLTFGDYTHQVQVSPGGSYFITTYSNLQTPPKMALLDKTGKMIRELGDAKGPDFDKFTVARTELVRVPTPDGFQLPVMIKYPTNFDPNKKYPVLISIYGGPNAGRVYDRWNFSPQEQWYAQDGLLQVGIDHRASGHFGKTGQNFMHRNLGKWEMEDYSTAVNWLIEKGLVDPRKVAITGGSYGGYVTALALTRGADVFTHGIANFGVMDWHLYDSEYTERFMDTPAENPDGYRESSVLTYADRLKGTLRIVHGTMDDNVHMQNSIQLVDKLEDLNKHFEFMVYPGARHGFGTKGKHAQAETARFIYRYLLEKPFPAEIWQ
ncbi:DPP IV N-terminal domain-containing protein [Larkinella bovis]|uniref:DPP IV N-terminal domain-containing protein n=1 Tax=Larkinella bovis TaxID=683041 RepID=A0ABW0IGH4_9BACT